MSNLKEFIYLDEDKLKSIFSQHEKGLLTEKQEVTSKEGKIQGSANLNKLLEILGLDLKGLGELIYSKDHTNKKILHDYMYNYLEEVLNYEKISDENKKFKDDWISGGLNYKPNFFILIEGFVSIHDYKYLSSLINEYNELLISLSTITNENPNIPDIEENFLWNIAKTQLISNNDLLNDSFIKSLSNIIHYFYDNKIIIKSRPFDDKLSLDFTGILNPIYLREDINDIVYKYTNSPMEKWYIFAQIATIFPKNDEKRKIDEYMEKINNNTEIVKKYDSYKKLTKNKNDFKIWRENNLTREDFIKLKNNSMETVLDYMFSALYSINEELSPKYPTITVTPIAIYRK